VSRVVDIQTISIAIASASVVAGVIYYSLQIRHQNRIRQTDLIIRLNPIFNVSATEFQQAGLTLLSLEYKDYNDFVKRFGSSATGKPELLAFHSVTNFFEAVGLLLKRHLVGIDIVWDYYGESAVLAWEKIKPLIEGFRKQYNTPRAWEPFEYVYNELKKREQKLQQSKA
jgi:hypothetical protein